MFTFLALYVASAAGYSGLLERETELLSPSPLPSPAAGMDLVDTRYKKTLDALEAVARMCDSHSKEFLKNEAKSVVATDWCELYLDSDPLNVIRYACCNGYLWPWKLISSYGSGDF